MAVKAEERYEATVRSAIFTTSNEKGTLGLSITFDTSDGDITHTFYVTENTAERLAENLDKCFSVTKAQLDDDAFLEGGINAFLKGKPCSITTEWKKDANGNQYKDAKGNTYADVQWMNPSRSGKKAEGASIKKLKSIFGGKTTSDDQGPPPVDWGGTDEQAPF
jgi:hypothetical protein